MPATKTKPVDREQLLAERRLIDDKLAADLDAENLIRRKALIVARKQTFLEDDTVGKELDTKVVNARAELKRLESERNQHIATRGAKGICLSAQRHDINNQLHLTAPVCIDEALTSLTDQIKHAASCSLRGTTFEDETDAGTRVSNHEEIQSFTIAAREAMRTIGRLRLEALCAADAERDIAKILKLVPVFTNTMQET